MCVSVNRSLIPPLPPSFRNIDQATTMLDANGLACEDVFKELGM